MTIPETCNNTNTHKKDKIVCFYEDTKGVFCMDSWLEILKIILSRKISSLKVNKTSFLLQIKITSSTNSISHIDCVLLASHAPHFHLQPRNPYPHPSILSSYLSKLTINIRRIILFICINTTK